MMTPEEEQKVIELILECFTEVKRHAFLEGYLQACNDILHILAGKGVRPHG